MDEIRFSPVDEPLRADVGFLGAMLGEVLCEQGGQELFSLVEQTRQAAILRRRGAPHSEAELADGLCDLPPQSANELVRAFSAYFSVVNMAEQVHRIRRRRDYLRDPASTQPGGLTAVLRELADSGVGLDRIREVLARTEIVPVLTAHPTEAIRRTILAKEQRIARALVDRLEHSEATPAETRANNARLRGEITLIWQTDEHSGRKPSVADEVEQVLFYLTEVVYRIVPPFYEALSEALATTFGEGAGDDLPCPIIRFASWVGGDMDGNPNVGPATILATLERQRQLVLERYRREVRSLFDRLSQSDSRVSVSDQVHERCRRYRELLPEVAGSIRSRYHSMSYRVLLWLIWGRLGATLEDRDEAYAGPQKLTTDLQLIADSLSRHRGLHAGHHLVMRLLRRVRTFGFHLATLDIRQDSLVHRRAVADLLQRPDLLELSSERRAELLRAAPMTTAADRDELEPATVTSLQVMRTIAEARRRFGAEAIGPYIISMAQGPDDVLAVLHLARCAGLVTAAGDVELDVAPLFETVDDLRGAGATMAAMLADPVYRRHLQARSNRQVVMLGYSDSSKISGIAASRWSLYRAQEELLAAAADAGSELTLFHGRGGTVGRGGSKPRQAILAEPAGAVRGRLRVTEQGEVIKAKYGLRGIAERTMELTTGAVLQVSAATGDRVEVSDEWRQVMELVAAEGRAAYEGLVHQHPDFETYFREATPIDVIERLQIGSRPASRRSGRGVENLRAIPWTFAWVQNRHLLPGWYGVGAGLAAAVERCGEQCLRDMASDWPFLGNLLADLEMVLAKADMAIAARYATLAGAAGEQVFPVIRNAYAETCRLVRQLQQVDELLDREPVLQRSIRLRNPYVDPMSLVQVDLLGRWRRSGRSDPALEQALLTTVRGIARGMQNTG